MTMPHTKPIQIRELDAKFAEARASFKENSLPRLLSYFYEPDHEAFRALAIDFFDIYSELNQVRQAAESHGREYNGARVKEELICDTNEQWQYYAAFFYHRLTSDSALSPSYTPEELEHLELKMSCGKDETMGLDHDDAVRTLGKLIRESMDVIKSGFKNSKIHTNNTIPSLNRGSSEKLETNLPFLS